MATQRLSPPLPPAEEPSPAPILPPAHAPARVLLAEESLPYRRVIREALTAFRECEVDDTPSGEHAFEMALRREYSLFIFSIPLPDLRGDMLDRLLVKAYPLAHRHRHTAPPVLYLTRPADHTLFESLKRDVRVRGSLSFPPRLDQLLAATASLLPERSQPVSAGLLPPVMPFSPPS
jgi:DNA-binding response OmpR family regulator